MKRKNRKWKQQVTMLAAAACLCLVVLGGYRDYMTPYGIVRMQINPDIMLSLEDYNYRFKKLKTVSDDLADKAVEMGFLAEGGEILLDVESEYDDWESETEYKLVIELTEHLNENVVITVEEKEKKEQEEKRRQSITIEIEDDDSVPAVSDDGNSSYKNESGGSSKETFLDDLAEDIRECVKNNKWTNLVDLEGESDYGYSDYQDTDYGVGNDGATGYDATDYGTSSAPAVITTV